MRSVAIFACLFSAFLGICRAEVPAEVTVLLKRDMADCLRASGVSPTDTDIEENVNRLLNHPSAVKHFEFTAGELSDFKAPKNPPSFAELRPAMTAVLGFFRDINRPAPEMLLHYDKLLKSGSLTAQQRVVLKRLTSFLMSDLGIKGTTN